MVIFHNIQYRKIFLFVALITAIMILSRFYQNGSQPGPVSKTTEIKQASQPKQTKLTPPPAPPTERKEAEFPKRNPTFSKIKNIDSEMEESNLEPDNIDPHRRNSEPPPQIWIFNQFKKTMSWLDWKYVPPDNWNRCTLRTYYFRKINTIFTGVPKTGCSNWLLALLHAEGEEADETDPEKIDTLAHDAVFASHRISRLIGVYGNGAMQKAFSFAVVRNPWTRLVSGYRDKFSGEKLNDNYRAIGIAIVSEMRGIKDPAVLQGLHPTFADYARWLVKKGSHHHDRYFYPQVTDLCIPHVKYDFILPLEHSETLSKEVWRRLSLQDIGLLGSYDNLSDPRVQKSAHFAKEWLSELETEVTDKLYSFYKADFILMNYSNFTHPDFPLPLHGT